jgi:dipeptidyl aminopeptidase/acylaminoacyl peptidase
MKTPISLTLALAGITLCPLTAQNKPTKTTGLPPIIDRELLFGEPEISGAQISPDGKYMSFQKPYQGTRNIWVKKTSEPFSAARVLTEEKKRPIAGYMWSRDSKYILFVKDNDGDENFNIYAVDPSADKPVARDLTGVKGIIVQLYSLPKSDPDTIYMGLNDRDKAWHDLYKLKISTGEKTLVRKNSEQVAAWVFDEQGQLRLAAHTAANGDNEVLRVDPNGFTKIYSCSVFESCGAVRFHKDGKRVYMVTNKGDRDRTELVLFDPVTLEEELVEADPLKRVDFGEASFSQVSEELTMTTYIDEKPRRYFRDKKLEADYKFLQSKFPGLEIEFRSMTADEQMMIVAATGDTEPGSVHLFDRKARKLTLQYVSREKLPRTSLSAMKPIRYKSSDGLEIPAYLTIPRGLEGKNLPTLIVPHGGPWARDMWGYNPLVQLLANRGYAVLTPNFRGSTGYGKQFINAGNGEWGKKMQDDLTWGVKHLVAEGIADPKRVGILGGSYGGYATLAGLAFTPDVYRAGVDIVGPSNLNTLLDSVPPYWEAIRKMLHARMADPATADGKAWLKDRSPLTAADKIKTPLFVIQGANDPRVNKAEAEQIVIALRDRKFPVEYMLAPDEGHGFARPVNNKAMYMAIEKFLAKHLDGRYQQDGTPEVEARLKELMVDVNSVKLAPKLEAGAVSVPKVTGKLEPGSYKYKAKISAGGQEIAIALETVIAEEGDVIVATDKMETPMGVVSDTARLDRDTLAVLSRNVKQGPVTIDVAYEGDKATGKMAMNGQERPIDAATGGAMFADAAGAQFAIGALPLETGYKTTYRNFDLQRQRPKLIQLTVVGEESVTVPAGTFTCFKVETSSADGGADKSTIWIDKASRKSVKMSATMASMGGASMVSELQ